MTMELLCRIIEENNIPKDVHFISDSERECNATEMDGLHYNRESNTIVFTQDGDKRDYEKSDKWEMKVPQISKKQLMYFWRDVPKVIERRTQEVIEQERQRSLDIINAEAME